MNRAEFEKREEEIKRDRLNRLAQAGVDVDLLTEEQLYWIFEPLEAPENFYADGELSDNAAYHNLKRLLEQSGMAGDQIEKIMIFLFRA